MGALLSKPIYTKKSEEGEGGDFIWAASGMQGWRRTMEDNHVHQAELKEDLKTFSIFCVFDGHAGHIVADKSAEKIPEFLRAEAPFNTLKDGEDYDTEEIKAAIVTAFMKLDAFMQPDRTIKEAGCTATGVVIGPKHFWFVNIGDSRSLLCRNKALQFATVDHKPMDEAERSRIINAGGHVTNNRVNGELAVSRALGDFKLKSNPNLGQALQSVSCEGDVDIIERDFGKDDCIIICCDGVYDVNSSEEVVDLVVKRLPLHDTLKDVCEEVADYACLKGSKDNISAMIISFKNSTVKRNETLVKKNLEFDEKLKGLAADYVKEAFADDKSAYEVERCFRWFNEHHAELFTNEELCQDYGMQIKKGPIHHQFDKDAMFIRDTRGAANRKRIQAELAEKARKKAECEKRGERYVSSDSDDDY